MESFCEPLKTVLCSVITYRTTLLLYYSLLTSFGAAASTCPPNSPLYRYVPTKLESIVGDQPVLSFSRDIHGNTWVATQSGLLRLTLGPYPNDGVITLSDTVLKRSQIFHLGISNNDTTYAITNDGDLFQYQPSTDDFSFVSKLNKHAMSHPNPLHHYLLSEVDHGRHRFRSNRQGWEQEAQSCWASSNKLFCPSSANMRSSIEVYRSPSGTKITAFFATLDNFVVIFLDNGEAFKVSTTLLQNAQKIDVDALENFSPSSFIQLDDGSVFLGTDKGVFRADGLGGSFYKLFTGRHQRITGFFSDNSGLWVSSESGVGYLTTTRSQNWPDNGHKPMETLSFSRSENNGYLIGTYDGIFHTNENLCGHTRVWSAKRGLAEDSRIPSIVEFEKLIFSGSFSNGISVLERKKGSQSLHLKYTALSGSGITVLHAGEDQLFAGTFRDGLYQFRSL